jgi:hypothetical protein
MRFDEVLRPLLTDRFTRASHPDCCTALPASRITSAAASTPRRIMSFKGKGKKGSILDLNKYMDQAIRVKFSGGREGQTARRR